MFKWIGIGVGAITLVLVGFIIAAIVLPSGFREGSRDIAIVLLASLQLIGAILTIAILLAVLFAINAINKLARDTIVPKVDIALVKANEILENTQTVSANVRDSASTATTTTVFVAERVASPIIRISSLASGVRAAAVTLARRGNKTEQSYVVDE